MRLGRVSATVVALAALGCAVASPERERRRFDCGGQRVVVSTKQRMPDALGGEEYVYATVVRDGAPSFKREIDINGRWTDQLGMSVAEDGSWLRFFLMDPTAPLETITKRDVDGDGEMDFVSERPGPAPRRYPYVYVAYLEVLSGKVARFASSESTKEEREAGWFTSTPELATVQIWRGREVRWRPCQ